MRERGSERGVQRKGGTEGEIKEGGREGKGWGLHEETEWRGEPTDVWLRNRLQRKSIFIFGTFFHLFISETCSSGCCLLLEHVCVHVCVFGNTMYMHPSFRCLFECKEAFNWRVLCMLISVYNCDAHFARLGCFCVCMCVGAGQRQSSVWSVWNNKAECSSCFLQGGYSAQHGGLTLHLPISLLSILPGSLKLPSTVQHVESNSCLIPGERVHRFRVETFNPSSPPQIVLHREKDVKQTECDMAMVHHLLSRIPQDLPYELLIGQAQELFDQYPPSLLAKRAALQSRKRWEAVSEVK